MKKPADILFFVLVFLLQLIIADYLHLGPWVCLTLVPFLILNIPFSRSPHAVLLAAFGMGLALDVLSAGVPGLNAFAAAAAAASTSPWEWGVSAMPVAMLVMQAIPSTPMPR